MSDFSICCCAFSLMKLKSLFVGKNRAAVVGIDKEGRAKVDPQALETMFYGHVQFCGAFDPGTGRRGLGIIPDAVIYNGTIFKFLEAFSHFKSKPGLHRYKAIFLEEHATLLSHGGQLKLDGNGGAALMVALAGKDHEPKFEIYPYHPGDRFSLLDP